MKRIYIILLLTMQSLISYCQILIDGPQGDPIITSPTIGMNGTSLFGNVNVTEQSIGMKFFVGFPGAVGALPAKILSFGLKAKPSDGIATLISNGKINAGASFSGTYTIIKVFAGAGSFIDFLNINAGIESNKYSFFRGDTTFKNQLYSKTFNPINLGLGYNALLSGRHLLSISLGYQRRSNYSDLSSVEIKEQTTYIDQNSNVTKVKTKTTQAKEGVFKEFDRFPLKFVYSILPPDGAGGNDIKPGFSFYLKKDSSVDKRIVDMGVSVYLTKANANGVRVPLIGLTLQGNDFFDILQKNNGLADRLSLSVSSVFTIVN